MAIRDLRSFVEALRARGLLEDVQVPVDPVYELGAVLHGFEQAGKAVMFHAVKGHDVPVVGSLVGSHERIAVALECDRDQISERVAAALASPLPPRRIEGPAPSQECVTDSEVDLGRWPIPIHAPKDAGPFINAGVVIARELGGGRHNLSFNRMQIYSATETGVNINVWRHLREFFAVAEAGRQNLPFCVAIGVDPTVLMAAAFRYEGDEYEIAGGLRGEPVEVAPALTCDLLVPATAEIIFECELLAGERRTEGPMAEFTGHYSGSHEQPVARVNAITHRRDPIFETIAGASFEHLILGNAVTRESSLLATTRKISKRVKDVHLPPYGSGFVALVNLAAPEPGEARNAALAAFHSHVNVKTAIVFDEDVDIFNPTDVLWAMATRVRWDRDVIRIPDAHGNELDPAADADGLVCKVIVDATLDHTLRSKYERVKYPPVRLEDYRSARS